MSKVKEEASGFRKIILNLIAFAFGIALFLCMFRISEIVFHHLNISRENKVRLEGTFKESMVTFDPLLGPKAKPNVEASSTKIVDNQILYDVIYSTDEFGRRKTEKTSNAKHFIAFFGGSHIFGIGINDEETLPAQVAKLVSGSNIYNYGYPGYGPQHTLAMLENKDFQEEILEKNGILIYVFIPHHVRRAIGSMRIAIRWGRAFPNYVIGENDNLKREGDFTNGRPSLTKWYKRISSYDTLRFFRIDMPLFISRKHLRHTARIIDESRTLFLKEFPDSRFFVLLYPDPANAEFSGTRIIPHLENRGIQYINLTDFINMKAAGNSINMDYHPSAQTHKHVAEQLIQELKIIN